MTVYEYVWLDNNNNFRSKTKVTQTEFTSLKDIPEWNYDGSSTKQANGWDSEVYIRPFAVYKDPFRLDLEGYVVLCDTWLPDGNPHPDNTRVKALSIFCHDKVKEEMHKQLIEMREKYGDSDVLTQQNLERYLNAKGLNKNK